MSLLPSEHDIKPGEWYLYNSQPVKIIFPQEYPYMGHRKFLVEYENGKQEHITRPFMKKALTKQTHPDLYI